MKNNFEKVKNYLLDLDYTIVHEDENDGVIVVNDDEAGINRLVIGCADPILIMEQFILDINNGTTDIFTKLLQKNRDIVHGAFALDESGKRLIFRDTLQLENLDLNELEGSINSLSLLLSEFSGELIEFSKN